MIGVLPSDDRISQLKPLGDRIMIKVCGVEVWECKVCGEGVC